MMSSVHILSAFGPHAALSHMLGPSTSIDGNIGCILDKLNPKLRVHYRAAGVVHKRAYRASIRSIGLKADLSVRIQAAFFWKPPLRQIHFHDVPIRLGSGIDIGFGSFHLTWAQFEQTSGGLLMIGTSFGMNVGLSSVVGGELIPVDD